MSFTIHSSYKLTDRQLAVTDKLVELIAGGNRHQTLLGVTGSGKTFVTANVIAKLNKPTLVIAHNKTLAAQLYQEYRDFFPENAVSYFVSYYDYYQPEAYIPQTDTYIEKETSINEMIDKLRLKATANLVSRRDVIVVASVSCIYNLGEPQEYLKKVLKLSLGQKITLRQLSEKLVDLMYMRSQMELARSNFRIRGNSLDIWPAYEDSVLRIEIESEKIKSLSWIDPISSQPVNNFGHPNHLNHPPLPSVALFPAKHYIADSKDIQPVFVQIRNDLHIRVKQLEAGGQELEAKRLIQKVEYDLAMIQELGYVNGIENYSRYFDGRKPGDPPYTLVDYFPKDFLLMIDESHVAVSQIGGMYEGDRARKQTLIDHGFRLPSAKDNRPLKFQEFEERIGLCIFTSATPGKYEHEKCSQVVEQIIRPTGLVDPQVTVRPVTPTNGSRGQVHDLIQEIHVRIERGERTLVTTLTKKMAEDLSEFLTDQNVKVQYLHSDVDTLDRITILSDFRKGTYDVLVGVNLLREGLDLPEVTLVAILDADKEGFLRSETSLIQTIGRAARNVRGEVLLYADVMTGSLKRALDETERRRNLQIAYNLEHGVTPKSIEKKINDIRGMLGGEEKIEEQIKNVLQVELTAEPHEMEEVIKEKEIEMKQAAQKLDFETAAILRDEIALLKKELKKKKADPREIESRPKN